MRAMRAASALTIALGLLPLVSCRALVDPGVTYRECNRDQVTEEFSGETTLKTLQEGCWQAANTADSPSDMFVDDDDLIIRVSEPASGSSAQWAGVEQGPMLYQHFEQDFLMVVRVEAVNKVSGDHCLTDGNRVGLVVRRSDPELAWSTFLIGPFMPPNLDPAADCIDAAEVPLPTKGVVQSHNDAWGPELIAEGDNQGGIGLDGEVDLVMCRVDNVLVFFYRDPMSETESPIWVQVGDHEVGSGAMDVGMTAAGAASAFEVEGHFAWTSFTGSIGADGCRGALEGITVPASE
jgi:hypothetical protein